MNSSRGNSTTSSRPKAIIYSFWALSKISKDRGWGPSLLKRLRSIQMRHRLGRRIPWEIISLRFWDGSWSRTCSQRKSNTPKISSLSKNTISLRLVNWGLPPWRKKSNCWVVKNIKKGSNISWTSSNPWLFPTFKKFSAFCSWTKALNKFRSLYKLSSLSYPISQSPVRSSSWGNNTISSKKKISLLPLWKKEIDIWASIQSPCSFLMIVTPAKIEIPRY